MTAIVAANTSMARARKAFAPKSAPTLSDDPAIPQEAGNQTLALGDEPVSHGSIRKAGEYGGVYLHSPAVVTF